MNTPQQRELEKIREAEQRGELVNIAWSGGEDRWKVLSNFAPTPFELDGAAYPSIEAFWQSLKFPVGSEKRAAIRQMEPAWRVKKAGRQQRWPQRVEYQGRTYPSAGPGHHQLADRAIRAKTDQNQLVSQRLLDTGDCRLVHVVVNQNGNISRDSYSLPREVFTDILTQIREELKRGEFRPDPPLPEPRARSEQISLI